MSHRHILTVDLEDYFQADAFACLIEPRHWARFPLRVEKSARIVLDLLARHATHATFFVSGWLAERCPDVVREVAAQGHEVASRGHEQRAPRELGPDGLRADLGRAREAIERASGRQILGYRAAGRICDPQEEWWLRVLAAEGYAYDATPRSSAGRLTAPRQHVVPGSSGDAHAVWTVPPSPVRVAGFALLAADALRQLPPFAIRMAARDWQRRPERAVLSFRAWELDADQPRITAAGALARFRHYRRLDRMRATLDAILAGDRFGSVAEALELVPRPTRWPPAAAVAPPPDNAGAEPVTIVVPCYDEERVIPFLARTLTDTARDLRDRYQLRYVLVDDGSRDGTWAALQRAFGEWPQATLTRHEVNRGIGAAILTGVRAAGTEIVGSIDCDGSYDPRLLAEMIPRLGPTVAMVTASPYHPAGRVRHVPRWRLALSLCAQALYRRVTDQRLHTYTSCCRVYRRSQVADVALDQGGFLGVAELAVRLDHGGRTLVEQPAVLETRLLGHSKMKALRTALGHARMLLRFWWQRPRRAIRTAGRGHAVRVPITKEPRA